MKFWDSFILLSILYIGEATAFDYDFYLTQHGRFRRSTNTTCSLQLTDSSKSFSGIISQHQQTGIGLIFFKLKIQDDLPDNINQVMVSPLSWIWATKNFGTNVLLLRELLPLFIYEYLHLGIINEEISVNSVPSDCLKSQDANEYTDLVLDLILNVNSTSALFQTDHICVVNYRTKEAIMKDEVEFYYKCYRKPNGVDIINEDIENGTFISFFYVIQFCLQASAFILFIFLVTPKTSNRSRNLFVVRLISDSEDLDVYISDKDKDFIEKDNYSFEIFSWLYKNVFLCQIRGDITELKRCCNSPVIPCCKQFKWFSFCTKIMQLSLVFCIISIFVLRLLMAIYFEDEEYTIRKSFASQKGYDLYRDHNPKSNYTYVLSIVSLVLFAVILIDTLTKKCLLHYISDLIQNKGEWEKGDALQKFSFKLFIWPLEKCGILGCFFLPFTVLFLVLSLIMRTRLKRFLFCSFGNSKNPLLSFLIFTFFYGLSVPILLVIGDIISMTITNLSFCFIIAMINYTEYLKYIIFILAILFYIVESFHKIAEKNHNFYIVLKEYMRDKVPFDSKLECNKCYFITENKKGLKLRLTKCNDEHKDGCDYKLRVTGGVPIVIEQGQRLILSRSFFTKAIATKQELKGFPGYPLYSFIYALCELLFITFFLVFIFLIIINFGDQYIGSDTAQAVATLGTGLLPWIVSQNILKSKDSDKLDTGDPEFQYAMKLLVSKHDEIITLVVSHKSSDSIFDKISTSESVSLFSVKIDKEEDESEGMDCKSEYILEM